MPWENEKEIHEMIGKFCVEFEQVCRSMEGCIRNILFSEGLTKDAYQEIILSGYNAEPLRSLLQKLIGEKIVNNKLELEICSKVFTVIQKLIADRNDVLHSKWFMLGMTIEEENKIIMAIGEKLHANKDGVNKKEFKLTKEYLQNLIDQCRKCSIMLSLFVRCVSELRTIEQCFSIEDKKLVVNYQALKPV